MNILGIIDLPIWLLLLIATVILIYVYLTWSFDTFKKLGIHGPKPYPLVGTILPMLTTSDMKKYDRDLLDKYGKFIGTFEGSTPVLIVSDPDALKQIFIKDFSIFRERALMVDPSFFDPPHDKMLTTISGDHWKHVRKLVTPTLTSGKLRKMVPQINACAAVMVANLEEMADKDEDIEIKVCTGNFAMDTIACIAFGIELNTQKDQDSMFVKMANKVMKAGGMIAMIILFMAPWLLNPLKKIGIVLFDPKPAQFFSKVVAKAIEERRSQNMQHSDFLQLMLNAHVDTPTKEDMEDEELAQSINYSQGDVWTTKGLTDAEIESQAVMFLLGGYATTSDTMSFMCYELAINPDAQDKLIQEVDEVTQGAPVTSEMASKLEYVEMCVMETLRKYPTPRTNRVASSDVNVGGINVPKDMRIDIPIAGIHYDPEIYPDPHKFIPERFTAEERKARHACHWIPFGLGPRNCIGLRFGMLETKIAMALIAQKIRFIRCENTEDPIEKFQFTGPTNPIKIRAEKR